MDFVTVAPLKMLLLTLLKEYNVPSIEKVVIREEWLRKAANIKD